MKKVNPKHRKSNKIHFVYVYGQAKIDFLNKFATSET